MATITKREQEILEYIIENPFITQMDIANKAGITRSSVAVHIRNLTQKGLIKGRAYIFPEAYYILSIGTISLGQYGAIHGNSFCQTHQGETDSGFDGAARNVAEMLKRSNVGVELLTAIGNDDTGQLMSQSLSLSGIPYHQSIRHAEEPSSKEICLMNPKTGQYTGLMDTKILSLLTPEYLKEKKEYIEGATMLYLDDELPKESIEYLVKEIDVPSYLTFRCERNLEKFKDTFHYMHAILLVQKHLEEFYGKPIEKYKELREAANWFLEQGVKEIYIAMDKGGVYFASAEGYGKVPNVLEPPIYWSGLGPAYIAGVMIGELEKRDIRSKAKIATLYARSTSLSLKPVHDDLSQEYIEQLGLKYFPELFV